jgi:predicted Zn-dependent peptidase
MRTLIPSTRLSGVLLLMLGTAVLAPQGAQQARQSPPPAGTPKNFTLPAPTRFTLPNGLAVTLVPFGQVPKVTIRLVVPAGNLYEAADQVWLADLTGRMLQEGTKTRAADALARELAGMGGSLSVAVSADTASIGAEVLAERAADAGRILAEVARDPRLPQDAFARVKAGLQRDLAIQKSTPQAIASERFAALMYGDHPYGRVFPTDAMLGGFTLEQVQAFHRAQFGPDRARLYVAGVFDTPAVEAAIRDAFGSWPRVQGRTAPAPPRPQPRGFALIDRAGAPQSTIFLGVRVPDPASPDWIAFTVMDSLLGGAFGSRITSNIREQKGYAYSPHSTVSANVKTAHWVETADVTTANTGDSLREIRTEIARLRSDPPPAAELAGIQKNMAGTFVVRNASRLGVIGQLAFVDLHGLGEDYLVKYVERVQAVTPEQVTAVARKYLDPDQMTLVVVGDEKLVKGQVEGTAEGEK